MSPPLCGPFPPWLAHWQFPFEQPEPHCAGIVGEEEHLQERLKQFDPHPEGIDPEDEQLQAFGSQFKPHPSGIDGEEEHLQSRLEQFDPHPEGIGFEDGHLHACGLQFEPHPSGIVGEVEQAQTLKAFFESSFFSCIGASLTVCLAKIFSYNFFASFAKSNKSSTTPVFLSGLLKNLPSFVHISGSIPSCLSSPSSPT